MTNISVTTPGIIEFVRRDIEILSEHHVVKVVEGMPTDPTIETARTIGATAKAVKWADVVVQWFGDVHSFFSTAFAQPFGTKTVLIVGGYDVANIPDLDYGNLRNRWRRNMMRYIIRNSDRILPVSDGLAREVSTFFNPEESGLRAVPLGFDHEKFRPSGDDTSSQVLTVALARDVDRARLKGLDVFAELAAELPTYDFTIVGVEGDAREFLAEDAPGNLELVGSKTVEELIPIYQDATVYCQLSVREAFGSALCEAMLCGCVPVCSDVISLPEVVGDVGHLVEYGDIDALASAVESAMKDGSPTESRERIKRQFPIQQREESLLGVIEEVHPPR